MRKIALRMSAMTGIEVVQQCVPEPTHLYHSELGVPGVLFRRSKVTDLSGLMNPRLVFDRPAFDDYCLADPPEVLFLPHWTHARLNDEIERSRCLALYARPNGILPSSSTLRPSAHPIVFRISRESASPLSLRLCDSISALISSACSCR